MPYASTSDLPLAVRNSLPAAAQRVFLAVVNSEKKRDLPDERAFASAWAAVKRTWEKTDAGWVKKGVDVDDFKTNASIAKIDVEQRLVSGWVSIVHDGDAPVVDSQGDIIDIDELRKAIHKFVRVRVGKAMHAGDQVAELVELVVVDDGLREELGAGPGPTGAWAVWKVNDDATWNLVKSGKFAGFSIGGRGKRVAIS